MADTPAGHETGRSPLTSGLAREVLSPLEVAAVGMKELFDALRRAGFSEGQAIRLVGTMSRKEV